MMITTTAGCTDGTWEEYSTTMSLTLSTLNTNVTIYVKFKDDEGNETSCTSKTITHDDTAPTVTGLSNDDTPKNTINWDWDCNETCTYRYIVDTNADTNPTGDYDDTQTASKDTGSGKFYLHVQAKDQPGNESDVVHVHAVIGTTSTGRWVHPADLADNISPNGEHVLFQQVAMDNNGNAIIVWKQNDGNKDQIFMSEYR